MTCLPTIMHVSNPTMPRVNPNGNDGPWVMMMYDAGSSVIINAPSGGMLTEKTLQECKQAMLHSLGNPANCPPQFCRGPEDALKKKSSLFLKKNEKENEGHVLAVDKWQRKWILILNYILNFNC